MGVQEEKCRGAGRNCHYPNVIGLRPKAAAHTKPNIDLIVSPTYD